MTHEDEQKEFVWLNAQNVWKTSLFMPITLALTNFCEVCFKSLQRIVEGRSIPNSDARE